MEQEELMLKYLDLQEQLKKAETTIESFGEKSKAFDEERNHWADEKAKLQQTNMDLFLRVSQPAPEVVKEQQQAQQEELSWDDIVSGI